MIKYKMRTVKSELPEGWVTCEFGDIAKIRSGYAFKSSWFKNKRETESDVPLIRQSQLKASIVDLSEAVFLDRTFHERFSEFRISKGDILIGMSGAIGKVCTYTHTSPSLQNQRTGKIELHAGDKIERKFLGLFLSNIERTLLEKAKGMGVQNISGKDICSLPFPMPPFNEQRRIVAKIEELFSELDKGIESLKAAQAKLDIYRQAVLKHAFEGKLTAQLRKENKDKLETPEQLLARIKLEREARYALQFQEWKAAVKRWKERGERGKRPTKPRKAPEPHLMGRATLANLPPLPDGYAYTYLADLGELGRGKSKHRPRNAPELFGGAYPFIQTGDVKAAGRIISVYSQTYSERGLEQSKLWPEGTLCITIAANIAETAFLGFDGCFPDSVVGFTATKTSVLPEYIELFIKSVRTRIEAYAPATAQKNINLTTLARLIVPLCSLAEQRVLVIKLEAVFSEIDNHCSVIDKQLLEASVLRQSILKKAFAGELIAQDPRDEPASVLLDRINEKRT